MYEMHAPVVWQMFPQLVPGVLLVDAIDAQASVAHLLPALHERARTRLAGGTESDLPEVLAWRRAYSQMGLKPTQYRSAAEALLRRLRRGEALPQLHPLVDLCNAVSLAYALPVAMFDLDGVVEYLEVRPARGDERYLAFSGEVEHPAPGEIIFADAADTVHARRWTFRQGRQSTVGAGTRRALIVSEGLHAAAAVDVPALLATLTELIGQVWSPPLARAVLTAAHPQFMAGA